MKASLHTPQAAITGPYPGSSNYSPQHVLEDEPDEAPPSYEQALNESVQSSQQASHPPPQNLYVPSQHRPSSINGQYYLQPTQNPSPYIPPQSRPHSWTPPTGTDPQRQSSSNSSVSKHADDLVTSIKKFDNFARENRGFAPFRVYCIASNIVHSVVHSVHPPDGSDPSQRSTCDGCRNDRNQQRSKRRNRRCNNC